MTSTIEPFYRSPNGDRWSLIGRSDGSVGVRHKANAPAGGRITEIGLTAFLACDSNGPEHHILARLVSTMPDFQFLPQRRAGPVLEPDHANAGQLRAARGLLNWSIERAAREAKVETDFVKAAEHGTIGTSKTGIAAERRLIRAFEMGGIAFIGDGSMSIGGSGIRMSATGTSGAGEDEAHADDANGNEAEASEAHIVSQ
jgi:hypothetical protein